MSDAAGGDLAQVLATGDVVAVDDAETAAVEVTEGLRRLLFLYGRIGARLPIR